MWKESKSLANVQERLYKVSVMGFGEREKKKKHLLGLQSSWLCIFTV